MRMSHKKKCQVKLFAYTLKDGCNGVLLFHCFLVVTVTFSRIFQVLKTPIVGLIFIKIELTFLNYYFISLNILG